MTDNPTVAEQLANVPDAPGVYLWKDAQGEVLYVGKAKSLRKRMRQYTSGHDDREKMQPPPRRFIGNYGLVPATQPSK